MTMGTGIRYRNAKSTDRRLELSTASHFPEKTRQKELTVVKGSIADAEKELASRQAALARIQDEISRSGNKKLQAQVNSAALAGFTIGIYYPETDSALSSRADSLQKSLKSAGIPADVKLYPKSESFLKTLPLPRTNEVRYEEAYEKVQAEALLAILKSVDSSRNYSLRTVLNRTPNFITIFLK